MLPDFLIKWRLLGKTVQVIHQSEARKYTKLKRKKSQPISTYYNKGLEKVFWSRDTIIFK
ncbi:Hypothetical predicted protein [Olea europaea subsp. europaea]|uniref:Uncharacterized protein n=1 Tax=Olea europaea subsp. europaea TaxID=158383 RepID=A0A8S0TH49_OLEEU|nr:Hypothetical predicted protein [Olea europaea subsp. europaea]